MSNVEQQLPLSNYSQSLTKGLLAKPFQAAIDIAFESITYSVDVTKKSSKAQLPWNKQKETKVILDNVSGIFKAGEVSAILGASGAGKTSLLNVLACRIKMSKGTLLANKIKYTHKTFGDFANYVMQTDVMIQTLTVRETLMFAANLKLKMSDKQKQEKVMRLTKSLKLENCLDTLVGGQLVKGVSGGQKKRTSIAFQLISDPQVIMLDQPTSGLDSLTSFVIVSHLNRLSREQGKTVLMTIHQPNAEIFSLFDRIFVMAEGNIVYQGQAKVSRDYFCENFELKGLPYQNIAEFLIEKTHSQSPENVKRYPLYLETYKKEIVPKVLKEIREMRVDDFNLRRAEVGSGSTIGVLLQRDVINIWRNPILFKSFIFQSIFMGLFVGGLFFGDGKQDFTDPTYFSAIAGFMFFLNITMFMTFLAPTSLVFPVERQVFLKEQNSKLYSVFSYFLSRNIIEIPYVLIMPAVFVLIFYWMIGLASTFQQFFQFYIVNILLGVCGNSLGLLIGSIILDVKSIPAGVPIVLLPFVLFSGFFKNTSSIPDWIGWIQYVSPFKYGFAAMMENQTEYKPSLIEVLSFNTSYWESVAILAGLVLGYRLLSLFFLWLLKSRLQ